MIGGSEREVFLALEVVEEAALGQACDLANILDSRRRVSLGANDVQGRVEELLFGLVMDAHRFHGIPMSVAPYQPVGMPLSRKRGDVKRVGAGIAGSDLGSPSAARWPDRQHDERGGDAE